MSKRKIKQMFDSTLEETLKVLDNNAELKKENKNLKNEINEKDKEIVYLQQLIANQDGGGVSDPPDASNPGEQTIDTSLAFQTALGAGAYTIGGRGGTKIHVTTLNWEGAGSLKEALTTTGAREIIFDVSGEIDATGQGGFSDVINGSSFDNVSILGQTAPDGGISIRTSEFRFRNVDQVILRYIRFRRANSGLTGSYSQDAAWFANCSNLIIDHCTFSHGNDESMSAAFSSGEMTNVTVQYCHFADSKTGSIVGVNNDNGNFSFIRNTFANCSHRFPNSKSDGQVDVINNCAYNWKERLVRLGDNGFYNGQCNHINNYYKGASEGIKRSNWFPNVIPIERLNQMQLNDSSTGRVHTRGNVIVGQRETPQPKDNDTWAVFAGSTLTGVAIKDPVPAQFFSSTEFPLLGKTFTPWTANESYQKLVVEGDTGAYKTLNADGSINTYRDTYDTAKLDEFVNDSWQSANPSGFSYVANGDLTYPTIPENTRAAGYYNVSKSADIPEAWYDLYMPSGSSATDLAPNGLSWFQNYVNEIDK